MHTQTPKLRFPEFSDKWEEKKLGEIAKNGFSNGVFNDPKKVGSGYKIINVKDMFIGNEINVETLTLVNIDEKEFLKNKVEYGDIFFTRSSLVKEGIAISNVNLSDSDELTYDGHLIKMSPKLDLFNPKFLALALKFEKTRYQFVVKGKTTTMTTIGQEEVSTVFLSLPQLPEQTKIANFLTAIDEKIQALKQKKTLLEQYKKGIMQQIFSQELRFKNDDGSDFDDWEEKSLGEIGENIIGLTYSPKDVQTEINEGILVLRSSNIKEDRLNLSDQVRVNSKIPEKLFVKKGDILICTRNGSQRLIGKSVQINDFKEPLTFGAFMSVFRSNQNNFIAHLFKTDTYIEQIQMNLGARINQITTGHLNKFCFNFPSLPEQQKIASFLTAIDEKIEKVSQQIATTETYKKGLLQQMFI